MPASLDPLVRDAFARVAPRLVVDGRSSKPTRGWHHRVAHWLAAVFLCSLGCSTRPKTSEEAREKAAQIWTTRCASCHGATGAGDGPSAVGLTPAPRSFKDRAWQIQAKDDQIAKVIVEGGAAQGMSPRMAANPDLRGEDEVVAALVAMIRGFQ